MNTELKQRVFDLIYEEPELEKGVNAAIACVGEAFGISRVYIFENNEANTHSSNTFEWCAEGISPQIDELQNMSFEEYDYASMFDADGMFFCPNTKQLPDVVRELMESQGICATLQYGIYDKGVFRGIVGFDDCVAPRPEWRDDGITLTTLVYISRLLSVCLLKERNLQRAQKLHAELEESLQAEKQMRETATRAAEAKTSFLSRMSHDMRTPMNGILGLAALSEDETDPNALKQNMLKIRNSGEYLLGLINDILDSQKIETGKLTLRPQVVDGTSFVKDMLEMVRRFAAEKEIDFRVDISDEEMSGYLRLDPIRAKQICLNLLSNAIKFTPEYGKVRFAIKGEDVSRGVREVTITVADTGVGMSRAFLENGLYQSFAQEYNALSSQNVSSGLGLSIVKRLVDMMDGEIDVESTLGVGTTFTVRLEVERVHEVAAAKLASDDTRNRETLRSVLNGRHILLVEDHPLNAEVACRLLAKMGCEVTRAENGQVAVQLFEASPIDAFDAVLMDIRMPVMDGLQSAAAIRALNRADAERVPILAMTANAYEEDVRASLDAGMNDHLAKPIEPQRLYDALAKWILHANEQKSAAYRGVSSSGAAVHKLSIDTLRELLNDVVNTKGAYAVEYEEFNRIYRFLARNMSRLQRRAQLVLFTVSRTELYRPLATSIHDSLRVGDLMMEFNDTQIVALLTNCDAADREKVVARIMNTMSSKALLNMEAVQFEICGIQ